MSVFGLMVSPISLQPPPTSVVNCLSARVDVAVSPLNRDEAPLGALHTSANRRGGGGRVAAIAAATVFILQRAATRNCLESKATPLQTSASDAMLFKGRGVDCLVVCARTVYRDTIINQRLERFENVHVK